MNTFYPKIIESDILVFGTPVYWYGPTALMKAFLDRFVYFNCPENRAKIRGKKAILVVPFEEKDEETAAPLVSMFEKSFEWLEIDLIDVLLAAGIGDRGAALKNEHVMNKVFRLGQNLGNVES